VSIRTTRCW